MLKFKYEAKSNYEKGIIHKTVFTISRDGGILLSHTVINVFYY